MRITITGRHGLGVLMALIALSAGAFWLGRYTAPEAQNIASYRQLGEAVGHGATSSGTGLSQPSVKESTSASSSLGSAVAVKYSYVVHANDSGADPMEMWAIRGDVVQIIFMVNATGTYHSGLDFRSAVGNTGPISPGVSKSIVFTADRSLRFTPYRPNTNIEQPYSIVVAVGIP